MDENEANIDVNGRDPDRGPTIDDEKLKQIIDRILVLERQKLHLEKPRGVIQAIEDVIKEYVK